MGYHIKENIQDIRQYFYEHHLLIRAFFFLFFDEQEFYSQDKTELQREYNSLILNDNLKTGRAETNIKRPKNIVQKGSLS